MCATLCQFGVAEMEASKKTSAAYTAGLKVGSKTPFVWPIGTAVPSMLRFVLMADFVLQGMVYTYCCAMVSVCADHTAKCMLSLSAVLACGSCKQSLILAGVY